MARQVGERWECECGEQLVAALHYSGKTAPITVAAKDDGNVWLARKDDGEVRYMVLAGPILDKAREQGMPLRLNHYADCPHAAKFKTL